MPSKKAGIYGTTGGTTTARAGQVGARERELQLSAIEELALGWFSAECGDRSPITVDSIERFGAFATRAGFGRDAAILGLGRVAQMLKARVTVH